MDKGWKEINQGADIKVPTIFRFLIQFVTPLMLGWVFIASLPDIWAKINNLAIKEQIAASSSSTEIAELTSQMNYLNGSRVLLLAIFVGISYLVYIAYKKRIKEGRKTA
jgi:hypothetical protein